MVLVLLSLGATVASDPLRPEQWALDVIGVERAWEAGRGEDVVVAIIDTGVALDHPDLAGRLARREDGSVDGLDLIDGGAPDDHHGYGTLVAGIVAATADNGEGIAGVAPRATLLPIRVLDGRGSGVGGDVDRAIRWAVDRGADVINLSLETASGSGQDRDRGRSSPRRRPRRPPTCRSPTRSRSSSPPLRRPPDPVEPPPSGQVAPPPPPERPTATGPSQPVGTATSDPPPIALAVLLLGVTMACWSFVARDLGRATA